MDGAPSGARPNPRDESEGVHASQGSPLEVLRAATRLGLTSFGGPVAHLGYFHDEYVVRRRWLDEETYADLVGLCQFLPGPASSELGIAIGIERAGLIGGLMAWLGFTLPSAAALTAFALVVRRTGTVNAPWLHGLQLVAVAVVSQAVWQMGRRLTPDGQRIGLAIVAAMIVLAWPVPAAQVLVIASAGLIGWRLLPAGELSARPAKPAPVGKKTAIGAWTLLVGLLLTLPLLRSLTANHTLAVVESFFQTGSLVFGGGHVVLPLLHASVVAPGWVGNGAFLTGYGAAQAVPGPLFTFAAYLGAVMGPAPNGIPGAALALGAIFLPAFLLVIGALPFWHGLRTRPGFRSALNGINAAVVGLLLAALYRPIWTSAVQSSTDFIIALGAFALLTWARLPPWAVVLVTAVATGIVTGLGAHV